MTTIMQTKIDLIGSSTFGLHKKISAARTWNMYVSDGWYEHYPGWKKVLELDPSLIGSQGRGGLKSTRGNIAVVCVGNTLWKFNTSKTAELIGTIDTHAGPVFMAENLSSQVCIVDGLGMYIYNRDDNTLTKQSVPGSLLPNYVDYHNTYFLVGNADTTGNGAQWFAFSFATAQTVVVTYTLALQTKSDYARAVVRLPGKGNNVLVLGECVGEIHTDVGGSIGYQRVSTINIDYGTISVATIARLGTFVFFLAVNEASVPTIAMFDGSSFKSVSTDGINGELEKVKFPQLSVGYLHSVGNHMFYVLTFYAPQDNKSYCYDIGADKFYDISDWNFDMHPARMVLYLGGNTFFISLKNGGIYQTGSEFLSQDENILNYPDPDYKFADNHAMPQVRVCSTFRKEGSLKGIGRRFSFTIEQGNDLAYSELSAVQNSENIVTQVVLEDMVSQEGEQLVVQGGRSTENHTITDFGSGVNYAPKLGVAISKNSGITYSAEVFKKMNYYGHRPNYVHWDGQGMFNEITFKAYFWGFGRFTATDAVFYYT